jgi:hypothetical protein
MVQLQYALQTSVHGVTLEAELLLRMLVEPGERILTLIKWVTVIT